MVRSIEQLSKEAGDMQGVLPDVPLDRYLNAASRACGEGYDRYEQGDLETAYIYLLRFVRLILSELPRRHPEWKAPHSVEMRNQTRLFKDQAMTAIHMLEDIQAQLRDVLRTDSAIHAREAQRAEAARAEEALREAKARVAAPLLKAAAVAATMPPIIDTSHILSTVGDGESRDVGSPLSNRASRYPALDGRTASAAPSYTAFLPPQQRYAPPPPPPPLLPPRLPLPPPPAVSTARAAAEGRLIDDAEGDSAANAGARGPSAAEQLMAELGDALSLAPPATEPARPAADVAGAPSLAQLVSLLEPPRAPPSAPSSVYPNNEERPHTSYTMDAVPKGPIVARGREAQDRHAVGAPPPPKLSARPAPTTQDQRVRLQHHLALRGFVEQPVPGDGNCQFHALVDQLRQNGVGDGVDAMSLRLKAVQWLKENAKRPMDDGSTGGITLLRDSIGVSDWARYLADMRRHGVTWGDEGTLLAVSALYRAEIVVISSLSEEYCHIVHPPPAWKIPLRMRLYLGHYHEFHYVSVRFA